MGSRPHCIETTLGAVSDLSEMTPTAAAAPRIEPGHMGATGAGASAAAGAGGVFVAYGVARTVYQDDGSDGRGDFGRGRRGAVVGNLAHSALTIQRTLEISEP